MHISDSRLLTDSRDNVDAAIVALSDESALVQSVDVLAPIVNNPRVFGRIAAANALSDVYAVGGRPLAAMNIVLFPYKTLPVEVLKEILQGGLEKIAESGAVLAGGHSVEDDEMKYGLAVSGLVHPNRFASNGGAKAGDLLVLTKPLGTGILATALKARWEDFSVYEQIISETCSRLNSSGVEILPDFNIKGVTDITGFGLAGHALEMAQASGVNMEIWPERVPILPHAYDLAAVGLVPAGTYANRSTFACKIAIEPELDPVLADLIFDVQTSGGLLISVPENKEKELLLRLLDNGDKAATIGRVLQGSKQNYGLKLCAN